MSNIDAIINKLGFELVEKINSVGKKKLKRKLVSNIEKSLGVLVKDGVYGYYVFCKHQDKDSEGNFREIFIKLPMETLGEIVKLEKGEDVSNNDPEERLFQKLSENLPQLLFFRQLLEKVLIYARYHVQAMGDEQ